MCNIFKRICYFIFKKLVLLVGINIWNLIHNKSLLDYVTGTEHAVHVLTWFNNGGLDKMAQFSNAFSFKIKSMYF